MKTRILKELTGGRYTAQIEVWELSAGDRDILAAHGEPLIQVGGLIEGSPAAGPKSGVTVSFELASELRRLPSQFPVKKVFDTRDHEDADAMAEVYSAVINQRIIEAYQALIAKGSSYTGEFIQTLPSE